MPRAASSLAERALRALKPGDWLADREVPGLIARRHQRTVSFSFRYSWAGKRRTMVIGEWETFDAMIRRPATSIRERPKYDAAETLERVRRGASPDELVEIVIEGGTPLLTLAEARDVVRELRRRLGRGENPAEQSKADWRTLTLAEAFDLYKDSGRERSERTIDGYQYLLDHYLGDWKPRPLASLTPRELHDKHREIGESGRYAANSAMRALRAIYNRARKIYPELPPNPCAAVDWFEETRRDAAIPREKLPKWWVEVQGLRNEVRRDLYTLTLFTALRRETAASIRLADLDLKAKNLHVPRPKGGTERAFTVPLSKFLVGMIRRRIAGNKARRVKSNKLRAKKKKPLLEPSPFLFPAYSASGHVSEPKSSRNDGFTVPFTLHGLRNTYISAATAAGVYPYAIKLLVNHALPKGDVTMGYVRADLEALRRDQERVMEYLLDLLEPDKVRQEGNVVALATGGTERN